ncbi:hypothetical protein MMC07_008002 [Pseudocyphellaria aurata]|nr:hypothetical protein [Pseudocyphellaria aurata]
MTVDNFNTGLSDWEVIDIYQVAKEEFSANTVLFVRHTNSVRQFFAVDKIVPYPCDLGEGKCWINDAIILPKIPLHPNIIKVYSSHVDVPRPGEMSIIFEFCAGGDLYALSYYAKMINEPIPEAFLWHILHQVWAALEHLHRHDISHNDVNMGNLLFRPVGGEAYPDVVLADFEFAQRLLPDDKWNDFRVLAWSIQYDITGLHPYSPALTELLKSLEDLSKPLTSEKKQELVRLSKKMACGDSNSISRRMPRWMSEYFANLHEYGFQRTGFTA